LYGCEIWGVDHCFKDSEPFEHLHIKFIKEILGVHCKATNAACLAELNRYPLRGRIQLATIKFLEHILNANNSLVNKVYSSTAKNSKWLNTVKDRVNKLGFGHLNFHTNNIAFYLTSIKQRIHDHAIQYLNCSIRECSKLEFFQNVFKINERPAYTDICKFKEDNLLYANLELVPTLLKLRRAGTLIFHMKIVFAYHAKLVSRR
jgi:hypothetical protein